ncbi:hypothetical protein, partial [Methanothrix sp.]|uniref:hypothetical protein n=1 Tax=Methanothrix sp. TaxID=90426 RepID=UPI00329A4810
RHNIIVVASPVLQGGVVDIFTSTLARGWAKVISIKKLILEFLSQTNSFCMTLGFSSSGSTSLSFKGGEECHAAVE